MSNKKRNTVILILAAVATPMAALAAIFTSWSDQDYSIAQQDDIEGGQDEQMLVQAMIAYDHGYNDTSYYLYWQVSNDTDKEHFSKDKIKNFYENWIPIKYKNANEFFGKGDTLREQSHYLIVTSVAITGGLVVFSATTGSKDPQHFPTGP